MPDSLAMKYCSSCGKPVATKFCAHCGAEAQTGEAAPPNDGWLSIAAETPVESQPHGVLAVALGLARAPMTTAMRLVDNSAYTGHWRFLLAALAVSFTTFQVVFLRALARLQNTAAPDNKWEFVTQQIVTVAAILIMVPIMYYACRWLSREQRPPRKYLKLAVLSYGYWYLLDTAMMLVLIAVAIVLALALKVSGHDTAIGPASTVLAGIGKLMEFGLVIWVVAVMNHRFWSLSWAAALVIAFGYLGLTQLVIFPALQDAINAADLEGWLKQLFG